MSLNMVLIGLFSFLNLNYAGSPKHRLLHVDFNGKVLKGAKKQVLTVPVIAILVAC